MLKLEKKDTKLTVLLNKNQLDDSTHVGKLIRNTFSVENLIQEIVENNTGIDCLMMGHAGELFKREILRQGQNGYAMNMLGLGTLDFAPGGEARKEPVTGISLLKKLNDDVSLFLGNRKHLL